MQKRENFSKKRVAILGALRESKSHPTAEQIFAQLRPKYPDLSLGTVYRNLRLFCQNGQAQSVGVIQGKERFDPIVTPHGHLLCERCGALEDVEGFSFGAEELERVSERTGLRIHSAHLLLQGLCRACGEEEHQAESAGAVPRRR